MIAPAAVTSPALRECPGCGLFQVVPALAPGQGAACERCGTMLRRAKADIVGRGLALTATALVLLIVLYATVLMHVETAGIALEAHLFSGPEELVRRGMSGLALVVAFTTVVAPFVRLSCLLYVLARLRSPRPPRYLRAVYVWVQRLGPWSMIDVFLFGVFVAYTKLGDIVTISVGVGVFALLALTAVMIWTDMSVDRQAVWEMLDRSGAAEPVPPHTRPAALLSCETCGLVAVRKPSTGKCRRCGAALHARKPDSIARTWALVAAAAVLYIPANLYPVLTVVQLGSGAPSTILGGVEELISARQYPLALLVFAASIAVPMLKLLGLAAMLLSIQTHRTGMLRDRTRLFAFVRWIGRWSMIDIFMESLLGALVRFGAVATIEPGAGAVAFCAVVILTMFAAECFDPRLMWDAAAAPARLALPRGARHEERSIREAPT